MKFDYLCIMENVFLKAIASVVLPAQILDYFTIVGVEQTKTEIHISLDERMNKELWLSGKTWGRFLNEAYLRRTYLRGRLHVLAGKEAVHCKDGCSALRERLQCTAGTVAVHCV